MNKILGAQLYTVRDFAKTPKEIEETFKKIKEIGYTTVQASGLGPIDAAELKKIADACGIKIVITHTPFDKFKNDISGVIRDHQILGAAYAGLGSMPEEYRNGDDGIWQFVRDSQVIADNLSKEGIKFSYHNHRFEFEKSGNRTKMQILADETSADNYLFTLDTYWVQAGGADPVEWIKQLSGRIDVIHFKDMAIKDDNQVMTEVLEGNLSWNAIFDICEQTNVKWYMVEQDICPANPFDSLKISYDNLKKFGFN